MMRRIIANLLISLDGVVEEPGDWHSPYFNEMGAAVDAIDVGGEVVDEVVLGQPGEALLVDVEVRQGRGRRCLPSSAPIDSPSSSPNPAM
jgi:hypothetical protein